MNSYLKILTTVPALLFNISCNGQIKNAKTTTVKIAGNCEMCEKTIESAANIKKTVSLDWNKETKTAALTYDENKTNPEEILKRIAYAGYDNEKFLAPDDAYAKLPSCCKYERTLKTMAIKNVTVENTHSIETNAISQTVAVNQFKNVFDSYFELKDVLIQSNANMAAEKAKALTQALSIIEMNKLEDAQHIVWMKVYKNLIAASETMTKTKDIAKQRTQFASLSENMHDLLKVAKLDLPVYFQHCPMYNNGKGANWLSMENAIKNPYYGAEMLSCGKTIETIK